MSAKRVTATAYGNLVHSNGALIRLNGGSVEGPENT